MINSAAIPSVESMRFSGHESFVCRYAWLPKAHRLLKKDKHAFSDEDKAMVLLGLGKNMVRSLRFWVEMAGIAAPSSDRGLKLTAFAGEVLSEAGHDPYLEDVRTLWLLHWNIATRVQGAPFAWRFLLNQWSYPEFTRTEAEVAFKRESEKLGHSHSIVTLAQHLDVFIRTYHSGRSAQVGAEDSLDGPLVDLQFLQTIGDRRVEGGRFEPVYSFRREPKPEITQQLFGYCLEDFWTRFRGGERTLTLREVALGMCSPGQVFKLPEDDVRTRLEEMSNLKVGRRFTYQSSAVQGLLTRNPRAPALTVATVYAK